MFKKGTKFEVGKLCFILAAASFTSGLIPSLVWNKTENYAMIIASLLSALFFVIGVYLIEEGVEK